MAVIPDLALVVRAIASAVSTVSTAAHTAVQTSGAGSGITDTVVSGPFLLAAGLALAAGAVSFASPCVLPLVPGYLSYLVGLVGSDGSTGRRRGSVGEPVPAGPTLAHATGDTTENATDRATDRATEDATDGFTARSTGDERLENGGAATAPAATVPAGMRGRAVLAAALFVLGFTVVFTAESALVLGLASGLRNHQELLMRIGGGVAIVMGLALAGFLPLLQREARIHARPRGRVLGAPLLGAAFGTGWLACTSPTLAGVLSLAYASDWNGSAWRGLFLVLIYCAGLGIPFVLIALGFGWAGSAMAFLRRHARGIQLAGAATLVLIGVLMVTGVWAEVIARLQVTVATVGTVL